MQHRVHGAKGNEEKREVVAEALYRIAFAVRFRVKQLVPSFINSQPYAERSEASPVLNTAPQKGDSSLTLSFFERDYFTMQ